MKEMLLFIEGLKYAGYIGPKLFITLYKIGYVFEIHIKVHGDLSMNF